MKSKARKFKVGDRVRFKVGASPYFDDSRDEIPSNRDSGVVIMLYPRHDEYVVSFDNGPATNNGPYELIVFEREVEKV